MKKKGFTLIELLAVIIILGILLLIAIPGVTGYINNSRKNVYVDTAKELIKGTSKLLNSGDFDSLNPDVTYYMDSRCISNESGKEAQSPFGKFNPAYVIIVSEDDNYNYYFQSRDETEVGVKDITKMDNLQISKIVSNVKEEDIDTTVAIGETSKTAIIDQNCNIGTPTDASRRISKEGEATITLTYDMDECSPTERYYHEEWGKLCKPKRAGYKLKGWYTKPNGEGVKIKKTDLALESLKVYGYWVEQEEATFDTGQIINRKMKLLANTGLTSATYDTLNDNITSIIYSEDEPEIDNMTENNIVSKSDSIEPIYMWYDNGTIYWWSNDDTPSLNNDSSYLFSNLNALVIIDELSSFDTSNVTKMNYLFFACNSMIEIDLDGWDTSKVTHMSSMFQRCKSLNYMDLSVIDTSKVNFMNSLFHECSALEEIDLSNVNTSSVYNVELMFSGCSSLKFLDLHTFDTSNVGNMNFMFQNCKKLSSIDLSNFNTSKVRTMSYLFNGCENATTIDLSNWNTSSATYMECMFWGCKNVRQLKVDSFYTPKVVSISYMFCECHNVNNLDISNFDTSNVNDLSYMFASCYELEYLDVSNFNTSKVTYMTRMFFNCYKINNLDVNNFDLSKTTRIGGMFTGCKSITTLDLSNWNTSNVNQISAGVMVGGNPYVAYGGGLFCDCISLTSVDLSNWDTSKVTDFVSMFENCTSLVTLDLSSFDNSSMTSFSKMFGNCTNLTTIYVSESFNYSGNLNTMYTKRVFDGCTSLVGGAGSKYSEISPNVYDDTRYLHIDGGPSNPGYFTYKART